MCRAPFHALLQFSVIRPIPTDSNLPPREVCLPAARACLMNRFDHPTPVTPPLFPQGSANPDCPPGRQLVPLSEALRPEPHEYLDIAPVRLLHLGTGCLASITNFYFMFGPGAGKRRRIFWRSDVNKINAFAKILLCK